MKVGDKIIISWVRHKDFEYDIGDIATVIDITFMSFYTDKSYFNMNNELNFDVKYKKYNYRQEKLNRILNPSK